MQQTQVSMENSCPELSDSGAGLDIWSFIHGGIKLFIEAAT